MHLHQWEAWMWGMEHDSPEELVAEVVGVLE